MLTSQHLCALDQESHNLLFQCLRVVCSALIPIFCLKLLLLFILRSKSQFIPCYTFRYLFMFLLVSINLIIFTVMFFSSILHQCYLYSYVFACYSSIYLLMFSDSCILFVCLTIWHILIQLINVLYLFLVDYDTPCLIYTYYFLYLFALYYNSIVHEFVLGFTLSLLVL